MTLQKKQVIYKLPLSLFPDDCVWPVQSLACVADIFGGGTPDTGVLEYWEPAGIPWATPTDITNTDGNEIFSTERSISTAGLKQSTLIPENSILLTSRATIGSAKINRIPMAINQGFAAFVPKPGYSTEYLFHLLEILKPTLVRLGAGTTFLETSRREIKKVLTQVPEENEQRRIAAVLKLADDAIDKAKAELDATHELKRSLMQTLFIFGVPGSHAEFVETKIGRIPKTWKVKQIREVLSQPPEAGISPPSRPEPPGTPILNVSCVKSGICNLSQVTYVDVNEEDIARSKAKVNDFYVLRGNGNREYVATGGLLRETPPENTIFSDKLILLRFNPEKVAFRFIPYMWQSPAFLVRLQSKAESGSGLWMMSRRDIVREFFAYPPILEQEEIVSILNGVEEQMIALENKSISLQDVKNSLLQNLLTGKIRIPEDVVHE